MNRSDKFLLRQIKYLQENPVEYAVFKWDVSNLRHLTVLIKGPPDSFYENGDFELEFIIPESYPSSKPICRMIIPIFHPDIDGVISLPILYSDMFFIVTIPQIVEAIIEALRHPDPSNPQNPMAAGLLLRNVNAFKEEVHRRIMANKLNL